MEGEREGFVLEGIDDPDVFLYFILAVQQFSTHRTMEEAASRFGKLVAKIIHYIRKQNHPNLIMHNNGLLYVNGTDKPATWMNAVENGRPITPRTG